MTNKDAAFLLTACRPNGGDANDPEFAEAFAQATHDPHLKIWLEHERRFDSAMARHLQAVAVPADLRSRILTGGRVSQPAPNVSLRRLWAIATMLIAFAGLAIWFTGAPLVVPNGWQDQALATLNQLVAGKAAFDAQSSNVADLQSWLRANNSPTTGALPTGLTHFASLGCKTISWQGRPLSIICFHGPAGELIHLAMMERTSMPNPPPEQPVYASIDGWNVVSWSHGRMAMMLATKAPEDQLRTLLTALPPPWRIAAE
jgi:hypothetical protein